MHAVDIANMTHGSKEVFGEMLKWLADVIGPQIREDRKAAIVTEDRATRFYKIEGTGWYYEYCSLRLKINDSPEDFVPPKFFHYQSNKAGGSHLYASKVMYIEDITRAVEFKLKW
jgi:hypothetical protein